MATQEYKILPGSESEIHDEPHSQGSRITVQDIQQGVEGRDEAPGRVADHLNLDVAVVYEALAYYHAKPEEMREVQARHDCAVTAARDRTDISPPKCPLSYRLGLDEKVEHVVGHRLENYGHDVRHVDLVPELGKGTDDNSIATFTLEEDRALVTYFGTE